MSGGPAGQILSDLGRDLRAALRSTRNHAVSSVMAVTALGVGIGLTATMYSIIYGAMRDLPFPDPASIVHLERAAPARGVEEMAVNVHDYRDWRSMQTSFVDLGAFYDGTINVTWGRGTPVSYPQGAFITPNAFEILGVRPVIGRTFLPDENDPDHAPALMISYEIWTERFDGDPGVVGRPVRVNGEPGQIVGVMPAGFRFPLDQEVWVPLWTRLDPRQLTRNAGAFLDVFGRLKPGVSLDQARQEFDLIAARLSAEHPESNAGVTARIESYVRQHVDPRLQRLFAPMMGAVLFVLLVACANVANLLVAEGIARRREIAVRAALGGTRARVAALAFARAGVLAAAGTGLGAGLAYGLVELFNRNLLGTDVPFWVDVRVDPQVLVFVALVGAAATLMAGLLPALRTSSVPPASVLGGGSRGVPSHGRGRIAAGLVIVQVGLSFSLLAGTSLVGRSVRQVAAAHEILPTRVLTGRVALFETTHPDEESRSGFLEDLEQALLEVPGIEDAGIVGAVPGDWRGVAYERMAVEGTVYPDPESRPFVHRVIASPGFFSTFDLAPLSGRAFDSRDGRDVQSVIVNQSFAARFLGDGAAVGRRIRVDGPGTAVGAYARDAEEWSTIVGVVPDFFIEGVNPRNPGTAGAYVPLRGNTRPFMSVAVRTAGPPGAMERALRETVAGLHPDIPVYWTRTMQDLLDRNAWLYRTFGSVFALFSSVALFLAVLGVFGVVSQVVRRRRREMSIRMALGARGAHLLRLLLAGIAVPVGAGIGAGLMLTLLFRRHLDGLLFETSYRSIEALVAAGAIIVLGALIATVAPGAALLRTRPAESLKVE